MNTQASTTSTIWQAPNPVRFIGAPSAAEPRISSPVLDFGDVWGTGAYRIRGTDTLTWGFQREWLKRKGILAVAQRFDTLITIQGNEWRDAELIVLLQGVIQQQTMLRELVAARPDNRATETGDQFIVAVQDALANDQPELARMLAQQGHRLHPQNEHLARLSIILAPPKVITDDLPADPDLVANLTWLKAHRTEYAGQWVAVAKGELRSVAPTLRELKHALGDLKGMLVTRVL